MFRHQNTTQIVKAKCVKSFTIVPNTILQDKNLRVEDKGLLCWLLSMSDGWIIYRSKLQDYHANGRDALNASFDRLIKLGYIVHEQKRENGRLSGSHYVVYSESQISSNSEKPLSDKPKPEKPLPENPITDAPPLISNNSISNNIKRNNTHTTSEQETSLSWDNKEEIANAILKFQPGLGLIAAAAEAVEFISYNAQKHQLNRTLTETLIKRWVETSTKLKDMRAPRAEWRGPVADAPRRKLREI